MVPISKVGILDSHIHTNSMRGNKMGEADRKKYQQDWEENPDQILSKNIVSNISIQPEMSCKKTVMSET